MFKNNITRDYMKLFKMNHRSNNEIEITKYICKKLDKYNINYIIDGIGNIICSKGTVDMKPLVCCHMDTVIGKPLNSRNIFIKNDDGKLTAWNKKTKKQCEIGGDDSTGVIACLELLRDKEVEELKCIFFSQEEIGTVGSHAINLQALSNVGYMIEVDRKGSSDVIKNYYGRSMISDEFETVLEPIMKDYDFSFAKGVYTDVCTLKKRDVDVCAINVSAGYYNAHTNDDSINIKELKHTIEFVKEIVTTYPMDLFRHEMEEYKPPVQNYINQPVKFSSGIPYSHDLDKLDITCTILDETLIRIFEQSTQGINSTDIIDSCTDDLTIDELTDLFDCVDCWTLSDCRKALKEMAIEEYGIEFEQELEQDDFFIN